jgi:hypothetical protein
MAKIYVASSWRCSNQPTVVAALRDAGHSVYDFRNPAPDKHGFHWSEIDPHWKQWAGADFLEGINHPIAQAAFDTDMNALKEAEICVLVMPCGRSAHLEAGYAIGVGKRTYILLEPDQPGESELMYKMADGIFTSLKDLVERVNALEDLEANAVRNTSYKSWHREEELRGPTPVSHLRHSFIELTEAEKAERDRQNKETPYA